MCQMDPFAETATIHFRIPDQKDEGDKSEESDHQGGGRGCQLAVHAHDEGRPDRRLKEGQEQADSLGCRDKERKVEELDVFRDNQPRPHRVEHLEQTRTEEDNADQDGKQAPQQVMSVFHGR